MSKAYNKPQVKSARKNERISEKERFDNNQEYISEREMKKYRGHARNIPAHINDDNSLTDSQKMLYGLLEALSHDTNHFGYCYATNGVLCKITNKKRRTLQRNLEKLHKKGLIIVEISQENSHESIRRIWTLEHFSIRDRLEKIYGKGKFKKYLYTHVKNVTPPCQKCHTYVATVANNTSIKEVVKKRSDSPKVAAPPSSATTTAFSYKKKKDKELKPQIWLTEEQRKELREKWGKIGEEVAKYIDDRMHADKKWYTRKSPFEDAKKFCKERTEKKAKIFRQEAKLSPEETENKNVEEINYFIYTYRPSPKIFKCDIKTKTIKIFNEDKNSFDSLDYTKEDFRKELYKWHELYLKKLNNK